MRGHRLTLICPPEASIRDAALARGLEVVALPIARKNLKGLFALFGWLLQHRHGVDIVNTHSSTDSWLPAAPLPTPGDAPPRVATPPPSFPLRRGRAPPSPHTTPPRARVTPAAQAPPEARPARARVRRAGRHRADGAEGRAARPGGGLGGGRLLKTSPGPPEGGGNPIAASP